MHRKRLKPIEENVTCKPLGVKKSAEITSRTHEQLDYLICRKEDNVTITDCFTDIRARLDSNHYPMIATMKLQFNNLKKEEASTPKYCDKTVWRDKERLNKKIAELIKCGGLKSHANWKKANVEIVEDQEAKEPRKWKEWISKETREMILERKAAMEKDTKKPQKT